MGGEMSQERLEELSVRYYNTALWNPCLLPDVVIDQSLLKYSGTNSNAELKRFSNDLINSVPGFVDRIGTRVAPLAAVPNAVGLGALVISMILEIIIKSTAAPSVDSYSLLQRVFAEEKGSAVRDTLTEYLRRHDIYINNQQILQPELHRLETQLSGHLTSLRNSMLLDGHTTSRGFKIWVNGAFFHIQMLIHKARLNHQAGTLTSNQVDSINRYINLYLQDLDPLLEKYKTYLASVTTLYKAVTCSRDGCYHTDCQIKNKESNCQVRHYEGFQDPCEGEALTKAYANQIVSKYPPITGLKSHFLNVKNNLNVLINQHDTFSLYSA